MTCVYLTQTGSFTARHSHKGTLAEEMHVHTFQYEVTFYGPLNEEGYLIDFRQVAATLRTEIDIPLHEKDLGTFLPNPTTEAVCIWIFNTLQKTLPFLYSVKVAEEPDRWITYTGE
jgi:6-pyruvoyltetrahydropterin/6-carboxytetrahydropterin synthase